MLIDIITFSNSTPVQSDQIELAPLDAKKLREMKSLNVTVCLVESSWLPEMKKDSDSLVFKGIKHPKKPLTYYFKETHEKTVFIDGSSYKEYGQLKRSIHDFLKNALNWRNDSVFFICVPDKLYKAGQDDIISAPRFKEIIKGQYENPLLRLISPASTKQDLKKRYIGNSEPCLLVRQMIAIAAQHDFPVLILGETGTGKEIVAHAIHECSNRKDQPFISINCSAIPTELFESEIFGFLKDSHSHASRDKKGLWEVADGGTLFLDEIGDLALNHQVKILRSLDSGEILPVGGIKPVKVDARIIAATNKNIDMMAIDNSPGFREDLYYRISTFIIRTPSLSSHPEDIPELAQKTWIELSKNKLSPAVLNRLRYMNWPGNVRLLKHFLRRLYAFFGGENITEEHVEVLRQQDLEGLLKFNRDPRDTLPLNDKDFEKVVMKIEYLLKAALYCEDERQRKDMLARVRESLENILQQ